jgi:hypothetical protein
MKFPEINTFEIFNFIFCQKLLMGFSLNFEVAMKNLKRKKMPTRDFQSEAITDKQFFLSLFTKMKTFQGIVNLLI